MTYSIVARDPATADFGSLGKVDQEGRTTEVWQQIDGEWKMIHFHCSNYKPGVMGGK